MSTSSEGLQNWLLLSCLNILPICMDILLKRILKVRNNYIAINLYNSPKTYIIGYKDTDPTSTKTSPCDGVLARFLT